MTKTLETRLTKLEERLLPRDVPVCRSVVVGDELDGSLWAKTAAGRCTADPGEPEQAFIARVCPEVPGVRYIIRRLVRPAFTTEVA